MIRTKRVFVSMPADCWLSNAQYELSLSVLDWATDFAPGRTILQQIQEAAVRCSAGLFLFTQDDRLSERGKADRAVPRDNVVFEAG
jgi:predicted nucleotide-binding protein